MAGLALTLYTFAFIYTEVVRAMLLFYLTPVWSTVLARLVLGDAITSLRQSHMHPSRMVPLATPMSAAQNSAAYNNMMKRQYDAMMGGAFPGLGYTPQSVKRSKTSGDYHIFSYKTLTSNNTRDMIIPAHSSR